MVVTLFTAYTVIAIVVAALAYVASVRLGDDRRPGPQRLLLSVTAGLLWPVMLLGLVEVSTVAVVAKVHEQDDEPARADVLV